MLNIYRYFSSSFAFLNQNIGQHIKNIDCRNFRNENGMKKKQECKRGCVTLEIGQINLLKMIKKTYS